MNRTVTDQADTLPIYLKSPEARIIGNGQSVKNKTMNKQNRVKQRNGSADIISKWREEREICQPTNLDQDHKSVIGLCTETEEKGQCK